MLTLKDESVAGTMSKSILKFEKALVNIHKTLPFGNPIYKPSLFDYHLMSCNASFS